MTKKLCELFNLPPDNNDNDDNFEHTNEDNIEDNNLLNPGDITEITTTALSNLEKIENALPQVRGLEAADSELDELANLAVNSYKDLMDLGSQVDSRFSSEIFAVGSTMLGHAITAKTAKINKKIKTIELQIKKQALDQKAAEKTKEIESTPVGNGRLLDRNEVLKMLNDRNNSPSNSPSNGRDNAHDNNSNSKDK